VLPSRALDERGGAPETHIDSLSVWVFFRVTLAVYLTCLGGLLSRYWAKFG
jgi:hypothetical protein